MTFTPRTDFDSSSHYQCNRDIADIAGLPSDLLLFHDAIFPEGEEVQRIEIKEADHKKFWWDYDVIEEEFRDKPGIWATPEEKAYHLKEKWRNS